MTLLSWACVSPYWYFIETMSVCRTVYIYTTLFAKWQQYKNNIMRHLASKNGVTLELGVEVVQGH